MMEPFAYEKKFHPLAFLNGILWGIVAAFFGAILVINALYSDVELSPLLSPFLSYGLLYSIGAAALMQTLRCKNENNSDAAFGLKLIAVIVYLLSVTVALLRMIVG